MPTIPPLPSQSRDGNCPWCKAVLLDEWYEDVLPREAEEVAAEKTCSNCDKPIAVRFEETTTYTPVITAQRSPADLRYMAHMGIPEGKPAHG